MWVAPRRMFVIFHPINLDEFSCWVCGGCSVSNFLLIRDGSSYRTGCDVITCLGGNEMKVSTTKGYVPNLVIFRKKY